MAADSACPRFGRCPVASVAVAYAPLRDPVVAVVLQSLQAWIELWRRMPESQRAQVRQAWPRACSIFSAMLGRWNRVTGLLKATVALLLDIGWGPCAPEQWHAEVGVLWVFSDVGTLPMEFKDSVKKSMMKEAWRKASLHADGSGFEKGANFAALRSMLAWFERRGKVAKLISTQPFPTQLLAAVGRQPAAATMPSTDRPSALDAGRRGTICYTLYGSARRRRPLKGSSSPKRGTMRKKQPRILSIAVSG